MLRKPLLESAKAPRNMLIPLQPLLVIIVNAGVMSDRRPNLDLALSPVSPPQPPNSPPNVLTWPKQNNNEKCGKLRASFCAFYGNIGNVSG